MHKNVLEQNEEEQHSSQNTCYLCKFKNQRLKKVY